MYGRNVAESGGRSNKRHGFIVLKEKREEEENGKKRSQRKQLLVFPDRHSYRPLLSIGCSHVSSSSGRVRGKHWNNIITIMTAMSRACISRNSVRFFCSRFCSDHCVLLSPISDLLSFYSSSFGGRDNGFNHHLRTRICPATWILSHKRIADCWPKRWLRIRMKDCCCQRWAKMMKRWAGMGKRQ